jgi:indole-3-glycerol phosphate synthase
LILDEIVANKRIELAAAKTERPLADLEARIASRPAPLDFSGALRRDRVSVIAEVKKASPSRGLLSADFDPVRLAQGYAAGGAAAVSVLTEVGHFQGNLSFLSEIKAAAGLQETPLLRKDFLFDPYQVHEARAFGADAILLIAAILEDAALAELSTLADRLGMQCLVEVHDEAELERALAAKAQGTEGSVVIGINNRDLRTFNVDIATTEKLAARIPKGHTIVSESGIRSRADIDRLGSCGVSAVLVGEALVTAKDTASQLKELV